MAIIPTAAQTVSILAEAMRLTAPLEASRIIAGPHPVTNSESLALVQLYCMATPVRQAILDVLVAATEDQRG